MLKQLTRRPAIWGLVTLAVVICWHCWPANDTVLFPVTFSDNKMGYVNASGYKVLAGDWDGANPFDENGIAFVHQNMRGWFIDRNGRQVKKIERNAHDESARDDFFRRTFEDNDPLPIPDIKKASAENNVVDDRGITANQLDKRLIYEGSEVFSATWGRLEFGAEDLAVVSDNGGMGYINRFGRIAIPLQWDEARAFSFGLAAVKRKERWGYIDNIGRLVVPLDLWDEARPFDERGYAAVSRRGKWGCIDRRGWLVIPLEWDLAPSFDIDGYAIVESNQKRGVIDRSGNVRVQIQFDWIDAFGPEGMARVRRNGKCGFVDRFGRVTIPLNWDWVDSFDRSGMARVEKNGEFTWIRCETEPIEPLDWETLVVCDKHKRPLPSRSRAWGFVDRSGRISDPANWNSVCKFSNGEERIRLGRVRSPNFLMVKRGHLGVADRAGNIIVQPVWDSVSLVTDGTNESVGIVASRITISFRGTKTICHLYGATGNRLWSSDWFEQWWISSIIVSIALVTVLIDTAWFFICKYKSSRMIEPSQ